MTGQHEAICKPKWNQVIQTGVNFPSPPATHVMLLPQVEFLNIWIVPLRLWHTSFCSPGRNYRTLAKWWCYIWKRQMEF